MTSPALQLSGIRKRFGSVPALDGANLLVRKGTVHALLGENGAGKTTLMRIAFGVTAPDEGNIRIDGVPLLPKSPADAIRAGLGMVQQHFTLVPAMTARENIALGATSGRGISEDAIRLAGQVGVRLDVNVPVGELSVSEQQRIELLKSLTRGAHVLILDEPTAALAPKDADALFTWIQGFRERSGSVVLITHKLREALAIADEISVLRHGRVTWSGPRDSAWIDSLVTAMLGEHATIKGVAAARAGVAETRPSPDAPVATAHGLVIRYALGVTRVKEASVRIDAGEILGVAGIDGSGSREFLYALAGRVQPSEGELRLPDEIGFIPEDRQQDALLLSESVADNIALRNAGRRRGRFHRDAAESAAERLMKIGGIGAADGRAPISTLSGGNQQRLVLAPELDGGPPLLVAVNPTRGLDIAATGEIQHPLRDAARAGMAVVYYAADLDELIEIADRVVVVFEGRVREVARERDAVGRAMLGVT